jgi:predicted transcriptional regulator
MIGELARRAGVRPQTIYGLETGMGKPQRRTVTKLARILGERLILPLE